PRPAAPVAPPAAAKPPAPAAAPAAAKPAAPSAPASAAPGGFPFTRKRAPIGPRWGREELQINASGAISTLYGPLFEKQDGFVRQCRMPEPPLLLADRVVGLDAVPGSMGLGTIWTETDVTWASWYLHQGRMPAGVLIEAGQADLMLISYLGIDLGHPGDRVYRLLGCTLTYHGDLPKPGETLRYDIHVDGHAKHGDVRLFFFHYDCFAGDRPILSVRGGQAGFFTDAELEASAGILWTPEGQEIVAQPRLDAPTIDGGKRSFSAAEVRAAAEGRVWEALGSAYDRTRTHVDTPRVQSGRMLFLGDTVLDPKGGPWGRGYLKSVQRIQPDDWFFDGHFKNDPCMPGTLMFEGCLQAMALYLTAMGVTVDRDGWRFQPVPGAKLDLRCRGQVDPGTTVLTYELFVEEFEAGPTPTLWADILCTSDELKAFHARRVGLQLVADWPAERRPGLLRLHNEERPVATQDGFSFGYPSLLACAWGRPSDAFGEMYRVFDGHRRVARLPGPPYHFMSRVNRIDGKVGEFKPGAVIELEYDVPRDAWYFGENDSPTMPFCVFLEAALQPCGWLASMVGSAVTVPDDLSFRNLDGVGTMLAEIGPEAGVFRTRVKITKISTTAGMIIEGFDVACFVGETQVYELQTVFGFFPKAALENQVGLPTTPEQRAILSLACDVAVDLKPRPAAYFGGALKLPGSMLCMIDRVTGWWPSGGPKGLGAARAEKDVDASEWFFKAHFFQDPVQPGSLGIEAMIRLLQWVMIEQRMGEGMASPRFEPLEIGGKMAWKYRGQVIPTNKVISTTIELTAVGEDARGRWARCDASLWVDGKRIYEAKDLGMRVVEKGPAAGPWLPLAPVLTPLDPAVDRWVGDHRPTWTVPALPMMSLIDLAAQAAGGPVRLVRDARVRRWVTVAGPTTLRAEVTGVVPAGVAVQIVDVEKGDVVFTCAVERREQLEHPAPWPAVQGEVQPDPYASGALFHGPAFQLLRRWVIGAADGAGWFEGTLDLDHPAAAAVPRGALVPALLDAGTHILPHDALAGRVRGVRPDEVAYPAVVERLELFGPAPTGGLVRVVAQALEAPAGRARFRIQWSQGERVWAELVLAEALFPKGPLGSAPPDQRRAFLRDRRGNGLALSRSAIASCGRRETTLSARTVAATDWLPGTVAGIYGTNDPLQVTQKEHMAAELLRDGSGPHPGTLPEAAPLARWTLDGAVENGVATVKSGPPALDLGRIEAFWRGWFNRGPWPVEDLYYGLMQKFIGQVLLEDPAGFAALRGRSVLFLANHQTGIESLLFSVLASALIEVPTVTVAKAEHRHTWLGDLIRHSFAFPGVSDPQVITYFDREDKASLLGLIAGLAEDMKAPGRCVMVHVEGTRALDCTRPVEKMSGAFIDMALAVGAPIVPVRFVGGLDRAPLAHRTEFPVGMGRQDIWFGAPLLPEALAAVPYGERKKRVLDGINRLGPAAADEQPSAADPAFAKRVSDWQAHTGCREEDAVLFCVLEDRAAPSPGSAALLAAADEESNALHVDPADPEQLWLGQLARALFGPRGPAVRGA
ncbi:MAG: hypothetical protein RL071_304, partial [Pseudomonadota bacterium]